MTLTAASLSSRMGEAHHHGPWVVARARRALHGLGHPGRASPAARVADAEAHVLARASALPALDSLAHLVHFLQPDNTRYRMRCQVLPADARALQVQPARLGGSMKLGPPLQHDAGREVVAVASAILFLALAPHDAAVDADLAVVAQANQRGSFLGVARAGDVLAVSVVDLPDQGTSHWWTLQPFCRATPGPRPWNRSGRRAGSGAGRVRRTSRPAVC